MFAKFTRSVPKDRNRRLATVVGIAAPVLLLANLAYAAWSVSGTQTVARGAGADVLLEVTDVSPATLLYPAGVADIAVTVKNTNSFNITVTSVTFGAVTTSGGVGGCTTANSLVTFTDDTGLTEPIASGATVTITLPGAAAMGVDSDDTCKNATFSALATVTGASSA